MNTFNNTLYKIMEWITRFAYVQLLWICFTFLGVIIVGIFPATVAMFAIIRHWIQGKTDIPVFHTFWNYYKSEFMKSNLLGVIIYIILLLITLDIYYIKMNEIATLSWVNIPLFAFILLFVLFSFYLFPAYVHYDLRIFLLIKNSFLIMLISPIHSSLILLCLISISLIIKIFPAIGIIFGASMYAFITSWLALHTFERIQHKSHS